MFTLIAAAALFVVEAGPASVSLAQYQKTFRDTQIVYAAEIGELRLNRVNCSCSPHEALRALLKGTSIDYDWFLDGTVNLFTQKKSCNPAEGANAPLPPCEPLPPGATLVRGEVLRFL